MNERHRRITSSVGLQAARRFIDDIVLDSDVDTDLPDIELEDFIKVLRVRLLGDNGSTLRVLSNPTYDDVTNRLVRTGLPTAWATKSVTSTTCTITLDGFPVGDTFTLTVEGYQSAVTLEDDDEPVFAADFHDAIIFGAMADELFKMEKFEASAMKEADFERRVSDLRLFLIKSGYQETYQGKNRPGVWNGSIYRDQFNDGWN